MVRDKAINGDSGQEHGDELAWLQRRGEER